MKNFNFLLIMALFLLALTIPAIGSGNIQSEDYGNSSDVIRANFVGGENIDTYEYTLDLDSLTLDVVVIKIDMVRGYKSCTIGCNGVSSLDSSWLDLSYGFKTSESGQTAWFETLQDSSQYWYQAYTVREANLNGFGAARCMVIKAVGGSQIPSGGLDVYLKVVFKRE